MPSPTTRLKPKPTVGWKPSPTSKLTPQLTLGGTLLSHPDWCVNPHWKQKRFYAKLKKGFVICMKSFLGFAVCNQFKTFFWFRIALRNPQNSLTDALHVTLRVSYSTTKVSSKPNSFLVLYENKKGFRIRCKLLTLKRVSCISRNLFLVSHKSFFVFSALLDESLHPHPDWRLLPISEGRFNPYAD
jgi:hypothetical protein